MKSLIVSAWDNHGGAARAALRLHRALMNDAYDSCMLVRIRGSDNPNIEGQLGPITKAIAMARPHFGNMLYGLGRVPDLGVRNGNWIPSRWAERIAALDVDVVNLHWVGYETLSIKDIGRIRQPIVWTLHDMWAFCGGEHYAPDDASARWRIGYSPGNRPANFGGWDLDRWVWGRKQKHWKRPMHIVTPSNWLAKCAQSSALFRDWPVTHIPNPLDTNVFRPLDRAFSREALGLSQDALLVAFGALEGSRDPRKGFDLLQLLLERLPGEGGIQAVIFGQSAPRKENGLPISAYWLGHIYDDVTLALLYSAVDVMIVPSRQENLPQMATEAQACGCPVLAFDCTGLPDAVEHGVTGYLARAFDVDDLVHGMEWILEDEERRKQLRINARARAERLWSHAVVIPQYLAVYRQARDLSHSGIIQ